VTGPTWQVVIVSLSDSFGAAIRGLIAELGGSVVEREPGGDGRDFGGAAAMVVLAGGAEEAALELLDDLSPPTPPCLVIGAATDHRLALAAVQRGARDYFACPGDLDLLRRSLDRLGREATGRIEAARFAEGERQTAGFDAILGRSSKLRRTLELAGRVATRGDATVLIGGETGTGKELLARAIHYGSPRATAPFVELNCAAIPLNLLESELFGHERGAFTGAVGEKPGLFELAQDGTLFLDEVGHLPLELQPKLLRVLEGKEVRRVGGQASRKVDVRLVAATHVDLPAAVQKGSFREDLYYRLNVVRLTLPPLRERDGDVELLAEAFAMQVARSYGLPLPVLSPEVRAALKAHRWPGNVRELRNAIERALVLSPPGALLVEDLELAAAHTGNGTGPGLPFPVDLGTLSRAAARAMLELTGGNKSEAARRLGVSRPRFMRLIAALST